MSEIQFSSYYTIHKNKKDALEELKEDTKKDIENYIQTLDEQDYIDIVNDYTGYEIHKMEDFDDEFNNYRPSEVLEELINIDIYNEYFDTYEKESANYIWDLTCSSENEMIFSMINGKYETWEDYIKEILEKYETRKNEIIDFYENNKTREYFEKLLYEHGKDEMFIVLSRAF